MARLLGLSNRPINCEGSQADRVIKKFGGAERLARILAAIGMPLDRTGIHRWRYPRGKRQGRGGFVPITAWPAIMAAARYDGIVLTSEDIDPRTTVMYRDKVRGPTPFPATISVRSKTGKQVG